MEPVFTGTDRFVIERQLGAGSMGAVYLAHDKKLGNKVALKVLLSVDATSIYRFKNEFRAIADVTHKNLVALHELFSVSDQWFFTMEYVEGKDLLSHVHGRRRLAYDSSPRPLSDHPPADDEASGVPFEEPVAGLEMLFPSPLEDAARLRAALAQVVEGLMAVHAAGKLHRDLKPENVLVTQEGRVKLLDFGIVVERKKDIHETIATIIGTPAYMSPEQCRGEGVTEATDWYALGVMIYEALTGDVPFDGTPLQVIQRKQEHDSLAPSKLVSGIPDDLEQLCMKLLSRDPNARPSGSEILRALRSDGDGGRVALSSLPPARQDAELIGRATPLMELSIALSATEEGMPVVALVHGNAGIGKTTLIERFLLEVTDSQSAVVLKGRCYERESVPFKAFDNVIDSLSRYLRRLPAVDVASMVPRDVDALAELFPVLRRVEVLRRNRRQRAALKEPLAQRQRAFRALKEMFARIADLDPLIVVVDDVQWSDVDSARLLGELITGADRPAMLLICSYRDVDTQHSPGLQALLDQVRSATEVSLHDIGLGTLTSEDSVELARRLLGESATEEGARLAGFECGGNPQLLTQLVRHVAQRRATGEASPATANAMITFEHVISRRLASLSTDARTLLELLSVAARPVPEPVLGLVASFNIDLQTALAELRSGTLVRGVATRDLRAVEVYHDTIAEAVRGGMERAVLTSWHRKLAAALEASGAMDLEALTEHLLGAGEHERASLYATRAAEHAERALAFDQAARLYGIAATHTPSAALKLELMRKFGDALVSAGRGRAAAKAYFEASEVANDETTTIELRALGAVQLLLDGELREGLERLHGPLSRLGIAVPASFTDATKLLIDGWHALRDRGYAFQARAEADLERSRIRRLDILWGVARGMLLHELDRPLPLIIQYLREALELGELRRITRGLALFHSQIDVPLSHAFQTSQSGALDVAEAIGRQLGDVATRAAIAFSRGLATYHDGQVSGGLNELRRAEEMFRNHCRGAAHEMRLSRTVFAHLSLAVHREIDVVLLRDWLREAEEHGDVLSTAHLRISVACTQLANDQAHQAAELLDSAVAALGDRFAGTIAIAEAMARAHVELYRGNANGALASLYLLEELFTTALSHVGMWRGLGLLLRARLALLARAGSTTQTNLREQAETALGDAAALNLGCFSDDIHLMRAALFAAGGTRDAILVELDAVLSAYAEARTPPLIALFALRAKGQVTGGASGHELTMRAETLLKQRKIENPRRFARLFMPGLEEALR